jgi:hypothetical protein
MAIYSHETRQKLAKLVYYAIFLNLVIILILVLFALIISGSSAAVAEAKSGLTTLIVFTFAAYLVQEKLKKPEDDFWRKFAEVLGSIQVCSICLGFIFIIGAFIIGFIAAFAGIPLNFGTQSETTVTTYTCTTVVNEYSTACVLTASGCIPIPPSPTIPPYGNKLWQNDPIIGSFIFEKSQFDPDEMYYSRSGNSEYDYQVVPLDHSPDIKWAFREDGILLFSDNTNGNLLRIGTWEKDDSVDKSEYKIKRGNWDYRGTYKNGVLQITRPDYWKMTKIE